jgi:hypothetical protein
MPFVDGEPIDAAKLGKLETELNLLKSQIPNFGGSDTTININNSTTSNTNTISSGPQIEAGNHSSGLVKSTKESYFVGFSQVKFNKIPFVVISLRGGLTSNVVSARVQKVEQDGFTYVISAPTSSIGQGSLGISYIAISY